MPNPDRLQAEAPRASSPFTVKSKLHRFLPALGVFLLSVMNHAPAQEKPIYQDPHATVEDRVNDLLSRMTLEEKVDLIGGHGFETFANQRLNIPAIVMSDGRMGIHFRSPSIAYPGGIALSASWDRDLATRFGESIGRDARARGVHIWLAPMVNIYRTPVGGRNFECAGEDPFLVSKMAVSMVKAVQADGVMATAVIFACNDQDFKNQNGLNRQTANSIVDERTLREIYFPPFRALAQDAHVGAFMASYNLLNGEHCTQNSHLLHDILKDEWGFKGFVMSDWGATHDAIGAANAGLDIEMPTGKYFNRALLLPAIQNGKIKQEVIDDKIRRLLREFFAFGFFDRQQKDASIPIDNPQSDAVALDMAREEMVLLKNQANALPLDRKKIHTIAVIGPNADPAVISGSGSSYPVHPTRTVSVLDGVRTAAGPSIQVTTVPWLQYPTQEIPTGMRPVADLIADSVKAAKQADVAVVCVGFKRLKNDNNMPIGKDLSADEGEGIDRSFALPPGQVQLLQAVVAANPHTVVILNAGGGVDWNGWLDQVPALIDAWYPGQEGGRALAEILFGDVNPSGKLPATFEKKWEDNPSSHFYDTAVAKQAIYGEGIFLGYRGFDQKGIEPQFPFGFGLSYTTFSYDNLRVDQSGDSQNPQVTIHCDVKNTGASAGAEIVQVYVSDPHASVPRPPKELKGFCRVQLAPSETKTVDVELDRNAFTFYDVPGKSWKLEPGDFIIQVGASSRDLPLKQTIKL